MKIIKNNYKRLTTLTILLSLLVITIGCGGGAGAGGGMTGTVGSDGITSLNSTTLSWDAPTTNADGTPLTDLAGYKVYYGTSSGDYTVSVDVGNNTGALISSLESGSWCFAVTAYDISGNESYYSEESCKTI